MSVCLGEGKEAVVLKIQNLSNVVTPHWPLDSAFLIWFKTNWYMMARFFMSYTGKHKMDREKVEC